MAENNSSAPLKTAEGAYPALPAPVSEQFQGNDDGWYGFMDARHEQATMRSGEWPIRELFTAEQMRAYAAQAVAAQAPTGNWINADDVSRLARDLDVALHGEDGAASQAALCDVVGLVKEAARKIGRPVLAAQAAPAAVAVTDAQIDAILDEPAGMIFYVSDQRHKQHLFARRVLALATPALPATEDSSAGDRAEVHPDDAAVDALAVKMKAKLSKQRAKGYGGWDTPECSQQRLSAMLRDHVAKGDPVDVANFCAFLAARSEGIEAEVQAEPVSSDPVAWHSKLYGTCWMHKQPYHLDAGTHFFVRGNPNPVATVLSGAAIQWHTGTAAFEHGTFFYTAPQAQPADALTDPIRQLISKHAALLAENETAYFELCYHRTTGWMAWLTDKPLCMPTVINPGRKVIAQGQGDTAEEACADAMAAAQEGGNAAKEA